MNKEMQNIQEAMEQVHISEQMREQVLENVLARMGENAREKKSRRTGERRFRRFAVAAAAVLAACIVSVPTRAVMGDFVRMRMENIPKEDIQDIQDMIRTGYSEVKKERRDVTDEEWRRYGTLYKAYYWEGRFPVEPVLIVEREEDIDPEKMCFVKETFTYYFPDRELTDEELLQLIDFNNTLNYALEETEEHKKYEKEQAKIQNMLRERVREEGGISEEEAIGIAKELARERLGDKVDEGEWKVFLKDVKWAYNKRKGSVAYSVDLMGRDGAVRCYYLLDSADGAVMDKFFPY